VIVIKAKNVNEALPNGLQLLYEKGVERDSRNGKVRVVDCPITTVYTNPTERVLFHAWRDANPFFHFYESLWMLAGRRDVRPVARFVERMRSFSDDGSIFNAAYGYRWRHATTQDVDQLVNISEKLKRNPDDRRCVLQIWSLKHDLLYSGKDAACNTMATFQRGIEGELNMTVFCRSNDVVWGCYGANAVHFSMLLEYVAARVNCRVGTYTQISVNWHGYVATTDPLLEFRHDTSDAYEMEPVYPFPLSDGPLDDTWDEDCQSFITRDGTAPDGRSFKNRFFVDVAYPIVKAHDLYKDGKLDEAVGMVDRIEASDWSLACRQWLERRIARRKKAEDDGVHGATP
jgi:thymidylate synthase